MKVQISYKGELPKYETASASGMDVRALLTSNLVIEPGEVAAIPTGLFVAIPEGYEIQVRPRSGLAAKQQLTVLNSPGTIDADYRGEIKVLLINHSSTPKVVANQDRIAQLVLCPVLKIEWEQVDILDNTARGSGGFGSTGV